MSRPLLLGLSLCLPVLAHAAGEFDTRFDGDGVRIVDARQGPSAYDRFTDGVVDAQGRYVGAGNTIGAGAGAFVLRLQPGGALDAGFGSGGIARIALPDGYLSLRVTGLVARADGRVVVGMSAGGGGPTAAYLCQLLPNGAPDPEFGGGCFRPALWPDSSNDEVTDLALQPDGRLVMLGETNVGGGSQEYVVARFEEDGGFDACFGDAGCQSGGYVIEPEPAADVGLFEPRALALAPDGRIVLAGGAAQNGSLDMTVIRLLPTAEADAGFGNGGHRKIEFNQGGNNLDRAEDVVVTANGRILIVGQVRTDFGILSGAAALASSGNLVAAYGDSGRRVFFFDDVSMTQVATSAALQDDGKLVVGGYAGVQIDQGQNCGLARLDAEGDLDPTFAFGGYRSYDGSPQQAGTLLDGCYSVGLHGGAIVLFGDTGTDYVNLRDSLVMKIDQDTLLRDGFEGQP